MTEAILTIFGVFIANAVMIIPLFLWNRAEVRADARHNDSSFESIRELIRSIHSEVRDFHERLLEIEKRK